MRYCYIAFLLLLVQDVGTAFAQHADIFVDVVDEQLTVNDRLFLSDFRSSLDNNSDLLELNNPGYVTQGANVLHPGTLLSFDIVGPLLFSDGTGWRPVESSVYFELLRPLVEDHSVVVTGRSTSQSGFPLAQADARGTIHEHIRFQLGNNEPGPPPPGVYGVQKVLTAPPYESTDSYLLIFNNGVDTPSFIQSVVAARELIADSAFDCSGDGLLMANDLACVDEIEQRDAVLRSIGSVVGDLDGNGRVEFSDFLTLAQNFAREDVGYAAGDIDLINGVAFTDFLVLARNFGFDRHTDVASAPEPSVGNVLASALITCLGLAPFGRTKRTRS